MCCEQGTTCEEDEANPGKNRCHEPSMGCPDESKCCFENCDTVPGDQVDGSCCPDSDICCMMDPAQGPVQGNFLCCNGDDMCTKDIFSGMNVCAQKADCETCCGGDGKCDDLIGGQEDGSCCREGHTCCQVNTGIAPQNGDYMCCEQGTTCEEDEANPGKNRCHAGMGPNPTSMPTAMPTTPMPTTPMPTSMPTSTPTEDEVPTEEPTETPGVPDTPDNTINGNFTCEADRQPEPEDVQKAIAYSIEGISSSQVQATRGAAAFGGVTAWVYSIVRIPKNQVSETADKVYGAFRTNTVVHEFQKMNKQFCTVAKLGVQSGPSCLLLCGSGTKASEDDFACYCDYSCAGNGDCCKSFDSLCQ
jgi:hypothetical protein